MSPPKDFAKRLVAQQHIDASLQQKYKQEIDKMFVEQLSMPRKANFALRIVFCVAMMFFFGHHWMTNRGEPPQDLIMDAAAVLVCGVSGIYLVRVLLRGALDRRIQDKLTAHLQLALIIALVVMTYLTAARTLDPVSSVRVLAGGAILITLFAMLHLTVLIRESRMQLEERNLELQYRIAELIEQTKKPQ
jgi:NhaP-type Na+/H+ or K+/H+ antiporter